MNRMLIFCLSGMLATACATTDPYDLPEWDDYDIGTEAVQPIELPKLPAFEGGVVSRNDLLALKAYEEASEGNVEIAAGNAVAAEEAALSCLDLQAAGVYQRELYRQRQEQLEAERRAHQADNWFYRSVITLGVLVGLVAAN